MLQYKNDYYLGNQKLKRVNVPQNYTPHQLKEFLKCMKDPIYFIKTYVKIINVDRGIINFDLYDFQEDMLNVMVNNRYSIHKLPRQSGKTSSVVALMLWYTLFHENYSIAILANRKEQSQEILSRYQLAYENLPKWIQQGVVEWNKRSIELENGCKIAADATTGSAARGTSRNMIYLDEFAFVDNNLQDEFFASAFPVISSGKTTKVIMTSTPHGLNKFYKLWSDSEKGRSEFAPFAVEWDDIPGRDEEWKRKQIEIMGEEKFRQEFNCVVGDTIVEILDTYTGNIEKITMGDLYLRLNSLD